MLFKRIGKERLNLTKVCAQIKEISEVEVQATENEI